MIKSAGIAFVLICIFSVWGDKYSTFAVLVSAAIFGVCCAEWTLFTVDAVLTSAWRKLAAQTLAFFTFGLPALAVYILGLPGIFASAFSVGSLAGMYRLFYESTRQDRLVARAEATMATAFDELG